jgi:hypothetical protein
MPGILFAAVMLAMASPAVAHGADDLAPPVLLRAAGNPIDVGHGGLAAPCFADLEGRGVKDLLVGERDEGRLRIYHNYGTNARPEFKDYVFFKAGADLGRVPSG